MEVRVYLSVDHQAAHRMNIDAITPDDILILHIDGGRDHFVRQKLEHV